MTGSTEQCACGTFAIGRCATCDAPVCGMHSAMRDDRRLCRDHARSFDEEAARRQAAASAAAARREADAGRAKTLAVLQQIPDPDDRFYATFLVAQGRTRSRTDEVRAPSAEQRRRLFVDDRPRFFSAPDDDPGAWIWSDDAVLAWLASRPQLQARTITVRANKRGLLGGLKAYTVGRWKGWPVGRRHYEGSYRSGGSTTTLYLLTNGEIVEVPAGDSKSSPFKERGRLSDSIAWEIGQLAELPFTTR